MNAHPPQDAHRTTRSSTLRGTDIEAVVQRALSRIAPAWPLDRLVAVNPYLGMADLDMGSAAERLSQVAGARATRRHDELVEALEAIGVLDEELEAAAAASRDPRLPRRAAALREALATPGRPVTPKLPTLADAAFTATGHDWPGFLRSRISTFAADHLVTGGGRDVDEREAAATLYAAWLDEAGRDRALSLRGLRTARKLVASLPGTADELLRAGIARIGVEGLALERYLHRLLMDVGGWAAAAARIDRESDVGALRQLLAIRLAWELLLLDGVAQGLAHELELLRSELAARTDVPSVRIALELVAQDAIERARRRARLATLRTGVLPREATARPFLQMVCCIDVRSEVLRRSIEGLDDGVETIGFAGFFGLPIALRAPGQQDADARCPVLVQPSLVAEAPAMQRTPSLVARAWKSLKDLGVGSFALVETLGVTSLARLLRDGWGLGRRTSGAAPSAGVRLTTPLDVNARAHLAEGALRGMSLVKDFAQIVLFVGHGSTSTNNPHEHGLHCGACGGQTGDANARLLAALLRDPDVRRELAARGIDIPDDTVFLAGLHDTTSDRITLLDVDHLGASQGADRARLERLLAEATARTRAERARRLGLRPGARADEDLPARGRDWAQTRPEWGLAGCSAFLVAPRARSRGADLEGRVFLHSYDAHLDTDGAVLEQILTAPMVVASWINLQYYASTVDNHVFGAGDKRLHDVAGRLGVLEGAAGDLRQGLALQSVHDGRRNAHEALRLDVVIEAPRARIDAVLAKHPEVGRLFAGHWLHLVALDDKGRPYLWQGPGVWTRRTSEVRRLGILGGGQLGQMLADAARRQGAHPVVLASSENDPAVVAGHDAVIGRLDDVESLTRFFAEVDVVTIENEFLDLEAIAQARADHARPLLPAPPALQATQDKLAQKELLRRLGIRSADYRVIYGEVHHTELGILGYLFPRGYVLKWSRFGYDGYGNFVVRQPAKASLEAVCEFVDAGRSQGAMVFAESLVDLQRELSVVATRDAKGEVHAFPAMWTFQERGVCRSTMGPAVKLGLAADLAEQAASIAARIGDALAFQGTYAVEMFLDADGRLLVNEIAPRVHNTGHATLQPGLTSQFDMHARAVLGQPVPTPPLAGFQVMRNLIAPHGLAGELPCEAPSLDLPEGVTLHWYGKQLARGGRKMGHMAAQAATRDEAERLLAAMTDVERTWQEALPAVEA